MKILVSALALSTLIFASSSCAKHDWEETKVLHEGSHGDHAHGDSHGKGTADAHGDAHATKPAAGGHAAEPAKH